MVSASGSFHWAQRVHGPPVGGGCQRRVFIAKYWSVNGRTASWLLFTGAWTFGWFLRSVRVPQEAPRAWARAAGGRISPPLPHVACPWGRRAPRGGLFRLAGPRRPCPRRPHQIPRDVHARAPMPPRPPGAPARPPVGSRRPQWSGGPPFAPHHCPSVHAPPAEASCPLVRVRAP